MALGGHGGERVTEPACCLAAVGGAGQPAPSPIRAAAFPSGAEHGRYRGDGLAPPVRVTGRPVPHGIRVRLRIQDQHPLMRAQAKQRLDERGLAAAGLAENYVMCGDDRMPDGSDVSQDPIEARFWQSGHADLRVSGVVTASTKRSR